MCNSGRDLIRLLPQTTETEVADQIHNGPKSQYTHTGATSRRADPLTPDAWQGSH